jgi:hypothetical protein
MNKKAQSGYGIHFMVRFIMIILVLGGISIALFVYYTKPIDLRKNEILIANNKLIECIQKNPAFILEEEGLSLQDCANYDKENFGTIIYLEDKEIKFGRLAIYEICSSTKKIESKVVCYKNNYLFLKDGKLERISILTGESKIGLNVK